MSKKLFVGGLSWGTTDDRLKEAFSRVGEVSEARVITDRETGRSRGFGFVTYADPALADQAIKELDGQELDGRTIRVNEAQAQAPRPRGVGGGPRDFGPPRTFGDRSPSPPPSAKPPGRGRETPGRDRDREGVARDRVGRGGRARDFSDDDD